MASVDGARSVQAASDEVLTYKCGPCGYRETDKDASSFCKDCEEYLCDPCAELHKGLKITRNHKLIPVSEVPRRINTGVESSSLVLCECSQNSGVIAYCADHDDVICQSCKTVKHRKCKTALVTEMSKSFKKDILDTVGVKTAKLRDDIKNILKDRSADIQKLAVGQESCRIDVTQFRQEMNAFMDLIEQEALKELETHGAVEKQNIAHHMTSCSATIELLEKDLKLIDDLTNVCGNADMYAANIRILAHLKDYENLYHDIIREMKSPVLSFKRNNDLTKLQQKIKEFGKVIVNYEQTNTPKSLFFTHLYVQSSSQVDNKLADDSSNPLVLGCGFLQDGQLVVCDSTNGKIKLLNNSFRITDSLKLLSWPRTVAVMNNDTVIITLPMLKQLQIIEVAPKLKAGVVIQLDRMVWGVDVVNDEIYVICHNWGGEGEVRVLSMEGDLKRKMGIQQDGSYMFNSPYYVKVSQLSRRVYISDYETSILTCLNEDASIVYQYQDSALQRPRDTCIDDGGNAIICGQDSKTVQIVDADGKRIRNLLTSKYVNRPASVAFRQTDNTLIIGQQAKVLVFKVK